MCMSLLKLEMEEFFIYTLALYFSLKYTHCANGPNELTVHLRRVLKTQGLTDARKCERALGIVQGSALR